jgi:hypothetical protein
MKRIFLPLLLITTLAFLPNLARGQDKAIQSLSVYPNQVVLHGPRDLQHLGVLGQTAGTVNEEVTRQAKYQSQNPQVAEVDARGVIRPVSDGKTVVQVSFAGKIADIPVEVKDAKKDLLVEFSRDVVPVLTRMGCNQGACHGAQHGKGGFKLSLFGFDPVFDFAQVVQSAEGRRVVLSDPERSILLQKPTLQLEHGGGERLKISDPGYETLKRWLEDGVPEPTNKDPIVTSVEVWPQHRIMVPDEQQQILVRATWEDGVSKDVTDTVQFDTLNEGVAVVSPGGLVTAKGKGETHIMIRFAGQATVVQITLPYAKLEKYPDYQPNNFIDEKLLVKWKDLGLTPSALCSDDDFFRRIHLDTLGTLPSPDDVKAFLADKAPDKRQKAIEKVLDRPEFVDNWALKWGDLLLINRKAMQDRGMWSFHNWVRASIRDDKPVDRMVQEIITAEGSTFTEGPANFFMTSRNPADWAESSSQIFLGVRIGCAKCHHHPFEKWSQDDYYGMSAFFVRLGTKNSQEFGLFGREQVVYLKDTGEQTHPRKGGAVKPHPLDGADMDDPIDRRVKLAEWITSPDNPFFARNMVNRFWGYYMGRGLVEPLDDMRATNPASNPDLLDALASDFIAHKYDLKHLLRTIMNSRAYQLSSLKTEGNAADAQNVHFTRFHVRRLTAEQMADAIDHATGTQTKYKGLPLGTKAVQLPDPEVNTFLLDTFGKPSRQIVCECERTSQPNIAQAMHLLHGDFLNIKLADGKGRIALLFKAKVKLPDIVTELYLVTLSRPPRPEEVQRGETWITTAPTPQEGAQDLLWALLNTREFLFNH